MAANVDEISSLIGSVIVIAIVGSIVIYLLLSLTLAELFKDATKLFYYRRGY